MQMSFSSMLSDLAGDISNTITNQMERLETALTSKKSRHERLGQHGLSKRGVPCQSWIFPPFLWTFIFFWQIQFPVPTSSSAPSAGFVTFFGDLGVGHAAHGDVNLAFPTAIFRWGEAQHPGPDNLSVFQVGSYSVVTMGRAFSSFSETQLSAITQKSCAKQFRHLASQQNRQEQLHFGAAVPARTTSDWAGGWCGAATVSDYASQELRLPYAGERECGRALVTRHVLGSTSFLNAVIYGYPSRPDMPSLTDLSYGLVL
jgi:hypothetical protein